MIEPTQPTNSIDSELEEILDWVAKMHTEKPRGWNDEMVTNIALKAIATKYVSRKEIEEAIGEDEPYIVNPHSKEYGGFGISSATTDYVAEGRNELRQELRAKLLPPTKGDK